MIDFEFKYDKIKAKIEELQNNLEINKNNLKNSSSEREINLYQRRINDCLDRIIILKSKLTYMRENNKDDLEERNKIRKTYSKLIKEMIPDDTPIVFHGVNNIGVVEQIIKSGGLFSCDDRGISDRSFASGIDVSYKNNISVTLEFADPSINDFMPYGAIFVFKPLDSEIDRVIKTGESTEVLGGLSSVNFRNEPDRLYGIITTTENLARVKEWCKKYGFDDKKVFTHKEFLVECQKLFNEPFFKHARI